MMAHLVALDNTKFIIEKKRNEYSNIHRIIQPNIAKLTFFIKKNILVRMIYTFLSNYFFH